LSTSISSLNRICAQIIAEMTAPDQRADEADVGAKKEEKNENLELAQIWREAKCNVLRDTLLSTAKFL